jgi:hypothetical protein
VSLLLEFKGSKRNPHVLGDCRSLADLQGGSLGDIGGEPRAEFCQIVREKRRLATGAGDGDVGEAGVEQIRVDIRIRMHEDTVRSETLSAMAGDGVAVVEVTMVGRVELVGLYKWNPARSQEFLEGQQPLAGGGEQQNRHSLPSSLDKNSCPRIL